MKAMRILYCLIEVFSMLATAFIGTCFYVGGFMIALIFAAIRYIYRSLKGGATA